MTLVQLRHFIALAQVGSFSKAAADLGIGQPSATKLVALKPVPEGYPLRGQT